MVGLMLGALLGASLMGEAEAHVMVPVVSVGQSLRSATQHQVGLGLFPSVQQNCPSAQLIP